ncbi:MAG: ABC transporter ATP-binding protein [Hyphococcus sp.]
MTPEQTPDLCVNIQNLEYTWANGVRALSIRRLSVREGERLFLQGPSGSGKSTLLGVIAGVFAPTAGEATILGHPFHAIAAALRDRVRADAMGVIFQQFNLVPYLNLVENVLLPCRFSRRRADRVGQSETERTDRAEHLLNRLGLKEEAHASRSASELSVGQQQRVAAARALIGAPSLIIADEPTSALDAETRDAFIETLLSEAQDAAVLFVSHDASLSKHFDRLVAIETINFSPDGRVVPLQQGAPFRAEA